MQNSTPTRMITHSLCVNLLHISHPLFSLSAIHSYGFFFMNWLVEMAFTKFTSDQHVCV